MEVKQIQPAHADHISGYKEKYLEEMFKNESVVAQRKYDGERMLIHFDHGKAYCTSRRFSKKTGRYMENQDKLPILQEFAKAIENLGYTVIDCEFYGKDWATAVGVLHSLPERAIELQKENEVKFAVFDCLWYDGMDITVLPYKNRQWYAQEAVRKISSNQVHTTFEYDSLVHSKAQWEWMMEDAIRAGFEGIVIKSLDRSYYDKAAMLKCKKFETVDVVVYDYQQGRGKYSDTIGALLVGYYDPETHSIIHISKVNCSTDEERDFWRDHWDELKFTVIEVKCQEITDTSLRHPVYIRRREDKDYKMCTKDTIFK